MDLHILNESKTRRKNLAMAWIDDKKAYDMVPQSWILHCLKMYDTLPSRTVYREDHGNLDSGFDSKRQKLCRDKDPNRHIPGICTITMIPINHILRKCTAGYKLSKSQEKINHVMYMDNIKLFAKKKKELQTLIQTVRIYSQDIGMEFGVEKCAMLVMTSGKRHLIEGVELQNQIVIRTLGGKETYKYSGILEADTIKQVEMKEKIKKEYLRRTRKLLETKIYSRNLVKGINNWAVPLIRYSEPFLKWIKEDLKQMDQRTRKLMIMHKALHPRDDVGRLYVSRKKGRKGLASSEDSVDASLQRLEDYIEKQGGRLITTTRNNTDDTRISSTTITRNQKWEEKQLYGRFKWLTSDISHEKTWTWLRIGNFMRETESLLIAALSNAIRIYHIKTRIDKTQQNSRCRLCGW